MPGPIAFWERTLSNKKYKYASLTTTHCVRTQCSSLTGNWLIAKVPRRMLGSYLGRIVWACIEFCHEEVDLITVEKFRDNAEAPFLERGGDCLEISHEYTYSDQIQVCLGMKIGEVVIPGDPGLDPGPGIQGSFQYPGSPHWRG